MKIPEQLKECFFCKIGRSDRVEDDIEALKRPFEKGWQNKPYSYEEAKSWRPVECGFINYGVLTGLNDFAVLDDDTDDKILLKLYEENFPKTFQCRGHKYIKLKNWDGQKIIFYDKEGKHMGELQGKGQQAIAPGSLHPSGEHYTVVCDLPIVEIDFELFQAIFSDYIMKNEPIKLKDLPKTKWEGDDVKEIPLSSIISFVGLRDVGGGCLQGSHPKHGSTGGMNFRVNTLNNTWVCYRCNKGGGSSELIAVMEGIIDCSQSGKSCFTPEQGRQVIEIAREKYGLKAPEIKEPMGWAKSINITRLAKKYNFTVCPKCNTVLTFDDYIGSFKCGGCKSYGGLKVFAKWIISKNLKGGKIEQWKIIQNS